VTLKELASKDGTKNATKPTLAWTSVYGIVYDVSKIGAALTQNHLLTGSGRLSLEEM
jgi:hypothetical protein